MTTGAIPHRGGLVDLELDFVGHCLRLRGSDGAERLVDLSSRPVADFYDETMAALRALGIETTVDARPNEVDPATPFGEDHHHATYDPEAANPDQAVAEFLHTTYRAAADLGGWDRQSLEDDPLRWPQHRVRAAR